MSTYLFLLLTSNVISAVLLFRVPVKRYMGLYLGYEWRAQDLSGIGTVIDMRVAYDQAHALFVLSLDFIKT